MNLDPNPVLAIMGAVLLTLLWLTAWAWLCVARRPDEPREHAAYVTAVTFGYSGLIVAYLLLMQI